MARNAAAAYLGAKMGKNVSVNTIRIFPIPYRQIGRDAVYEISDLDAFVDGKIATAQTRILGSAVTAEEDRRA